MGENAMHDTKLKSQGYLTVGSHISENYAQVLSAAALATKAASVTPSHKQIIEAMKLHGRIEQTKRTLDLHEIAYSQIYMKPLSSPDVLESIKSIQSLNTGWITHTSKVNTDNLESITKINNIISVILKYQNDVEASKPGPVTENYMANARSLIEAKIYARDFLKCKEYELFEIKQTALIKDNDKTSIWKRIFNWLVKDKMDFYHKSFNEAFSESIKKIDKTLQENGATK